MKEVVLTALAFALFIVGLVVIALAMWWWSR